MLEAGAYAFPQAYEIFSYSQPDFIENTHFNIHGTPISIPDFVL